MRNDELTDKQLADELQATRLAIKAVEALLKIRKEHGKSQRYTLDVFLLSLQGSEGALIAEQYRRSMK